LRVMVDLLAGRKPAEADLTRALAAEAAADADLRPRPPQPPGVVLGLSRMYRSRFDEARSAFATAHARATDRGDEETVEAVLFHSVRLECRAGNWERASVLANQVHELNALLDVGHRSGIGSLARALVAAHRGDPSARALIEEAIAGFSGSGLTIWEIESRTLLGLLELSRGEAAAAVRELEPLPNRLMRMGYREPTHLQAVPNLVEGCIERGDVEAARPLLEWYEQQATSQGHPLALVQAARCRGLLAAAEGDTGEALTRFGTALASELPEPFEHARTLLARGIVLRRAKRRHDARESLEDALARFEQLGARLWAERARSQLARLAGRRPAGTDLTATEQQVAERVIEGLSNKEVAAALFITAKGVEAHLSHIYRKLGIHSRNELARVYASKPS
jgi:DNA-binding CsgD family transcriptional regulator